MTTARNPVGTTVRAGADSSRRCRRRDDEQRDRAEYRDRADRNRDAWRRERQARAQPGAQSFAREQCEHRDCDRVPNQQADRGGHGHDGRRPRDRGVLQARRGPPPESQIREAQEADGQASRERAASGPARQCRPCGSVPRGQRAKPHRHGRDDRGWDTEQHDQIEGDDHGIGRAGNEIGGARPQPDGGGRAEQDSGERADAEAGRQCKRRRPRRRGGAAEHEAIDACIEIAEGAELIPQRLDAVVLLGGAWRRVHPLQNRRSETNSASSFR